MTFTKKRLLIGAAALAATAALALSGCTSSGDAANKSSDGKTSSITLFNGSTGNFTENFNPLNNTGAALQPTLGVIYEALYYFNFARAQDPVPVLATGYKWNADGTDLTITTRTGVKWADGQAFSANDVAYTLNLVQSNAALNTSGSKWTATATDDHTVDVKFPVTSFTLEAQILGNQAIVPEHIWKSIADPTKVTNDKPVGTGPYQLKTFTAQSYVLERNKNYWGQGDQAPQIDQVRYISLANADAATSALQSGQVDWMGSYLPTLKQIGIKPFLLGVTLWAFISVSSFCAVLWAMR